MGCAMSSFRLNIEGKQKKAGYPAFLFGMCEQPQLFFSLWFKIRVAEKWLKGYTVAPLKLCLV